MKRVEASGSVAPRAIGPSAPCLGLLLAPARGAMAEAMTGRGTDDTDGETCESKVVRRLWPFRVHCGSRTRGHQPCGNS
jgi:hypothetical protein